MLVWFATINEPILLVVTQVHTEFRFSQFLPAVHFCCCFSRIPSRTTLHLVVMCGRVSQTLFAYNILENFKGYWSGTLEDVPLLEFYYFLMIRHMVHFWGEDQRHKMPQCTCYMNVDIDYKHWIDGVFVKFSTIKLFPFPYIYSFEESTVYSPQLKSDELYLYECLLIDIYFIL